MTMEATLQCHSIFNLGDPNFVNEEGVKWWYVIAHRENTPHVKGWITEKPNGTKKFVVVDHASGEVLYESNRFEDCCVRMDLINFEQGD